MQKWVKDRRAAAWIVNSVRGLGPYVLIELVLPGGTLISLCLYLYRRRVAAQAAAAVLSA